MLMGYQSTQFSFGYNGLAFINVQFYLNQISQVIEKIGYMQTAEDNFTIFVEKSPAAIAVAESSLIPENISYRLIERKFRCEESNLTYPCRFA